jgi:hypothetical protein
MLTLRFPEGEIPHWASRYPVEDDYKVELILSPQVRRRGYFLQSEFREICFWKTPRSKPFVESNSEEFILEVTKTSLSTPSERLRIEVLNLLDGIKWPTASVLLHFGHTAPYPILDFRALWSLGIDVPPVDYDFNFWWEFTKFCRQLAGRAGVTMRNLDRALWQYSKENQKGTS